MGLPALSHLYSGFYLFALPTDQRKPEILQLNLFVGPEEGEERRHHPGGKAPTPRNHNSHTPTLPFQPDPAPASTLLLVKDWLLCHGNGPSSEGSYQPVIFWSLYSILCPSSLG